MSVLSVTAASSLVLMSSLSHLQNILKKHMEKNMREKGIVYSGDYRESRSGSGSLRERSSGRGRVR